MIFPWKSSADETLRELDHLHQSSQSRLARNRDDLTRAVAALDYGTAEEIGPASDGRVRDEEPAPRRAEPPAPEPPSFVPLPEIRRPIGGYYGPMVREKLTRIALEKRGW
ncbi:MAG TPA: hypothetical protein VM285_09980 [Polyangia bacterium]|nr:hypothetical protein [Polyangia bacterium]